MSDLDKPILNDNMKVVTCPKCGKIIQKSITTVSEFVCPCKYKFDAIVHQFLHLFYNPDLIKHNIQNHIFY